MNRSPSSGYTCFRGHQRFAWGPLESVALEVNRLSRQGEGEEEAVLIFDDATGRTVEVDTRGSESDVTARLRASGAAGAPSECDLAGESSPTRSGTLEAGASKDEARGRGRPKLGVVPREVTLLPRHWEWLATQPGGASVALRKLVEEARRTHAGKDRARRLQERTYHFITVIAGDLPGFEEAARALFAGDLARFSECMAPWPTDLREHALWLAHDHAGQTFS